MMSLDINRAADRHAAQRTPNIYREAEQLYAALQHAAVDDGVTCPIVLDALDSYEAFKRGWATLEVGS